MKSFYSFITERKRNPGRPGSQGPSETERAKSKAKTSRPTVNPRKPLTIDQILRAGRPEGAAAAVGADEAGVYIGSDKDAIKKAIDQERVSRGFGISKDDAARYAGIARLSAVVTDVITSVKTLSSCEQSAACCTHRGIRLAVPDSV